MRTLFLLLAVTLTACGTIRSQIEIDPGDQFVLGGNQRGAFSVELTNVGQGAVDVLEVDADGDTVWVARLVPGASASTWYRPGTAALLVNRSKEPTAVQATIRGDTNLGMVYQEAQ